MAFFGLAFARAWVSLVFVVPEASSPFSALPHGLFDVGYIACSIVAVAFARRIVPYARRRWAIPATLGGMLLASLAFVAGPAVSPPVAPVLAAAAAVLGGAAFLSCALLNAEAFVGVSVLRIALYLAGYNLLGSVLVFFLDGLDAVHTALAVLGLPVVAVSLFRAAWDSLPACDRQKAGYPRYVFPWKLIALFALVSFVYGLRSESLAAGAGRHASLSTALVAAIVFAAAYFFPQRFDVARLCRAPLPVILCGVLLLPVEGIVGQVVSSYLVSAGFTLMTLLVSILLYDMSKRTGVAIVPLMAAKSATQAFVLAGGALSGWLDGAAGALGGTAAVAVVCVALTAAFFLLFSERELTERFGIRVLAQGSLDEGERCEAGILSRCGELTRDHRLTPREEEVLRELAQRKASKEIMRNLVIAPGTLKAHTRHIYEKLGVHSREELYALLEGSRSEESASAASR